MIRTKIKSTKTKRTEGQWKKVPERRETLDEWRFYLITAFLLACIAAYQLMHISGMVLYPDEFGYWANAAGWIGFDWSETVTLQSFYSFGYSVILLPFLKWVTNPFILYKAALLVNVLFVYLHAVFLWKIIKEMERSVNILYCFMAAFYPALTFYMQVTLAESLLSLLFLLSVWMLLKWSRTGRDIYAAFFLVILAFIYFVHMRTVGILIAGIICFLWTVYVKNKNSDSTKKENPGFNIRNDRIPGIKKGKKKLILMLLLLAAFIILMLSGQEVKEALQTGIYQNVHENLLGTNDYGGQLRKVKYLFSRAGAIDFFISCLGKLFYLGIATLGAFYFGIWHIIKKIKKNTVCIFLTVSAAFTFFITAVYMIHGGRGDGYVYGRYNDIIIPLFLYFGLCEMEKSRYLFRGIAAAAGVHGMAACLLSVILHGKNPVEYQGYFTVGLSGYLPREVMAAAEEYILYPAIMGTVFMLLLGIVLGIFIRRKKILRYYMFLFIGFYIYTGMSAGGKYLYDHSRDTGADMAMIYQMGKRMEPEDRVVFYLSESDAHYLDIIQFCLRDHVLHIVSADERKEVKGETADFAITYSNYKQAEELEERYSEVISTYHFNLYYQPLTEPK